MKQLTTPNGDTAVVDHETHITCEPDSTAIARWSWFPDGILFVYYKGSDTAYLYKGVPALTVLRLLVADSVGRFIATEIKPKHELVGAY